jgi:uncharacterized protein
MTGAPVLSRLRGAALTMTVVLSLLVPATAGAQERTITVTGKATREVPNDTASLTFSVTKERRSRGAALRVVALRLREVVAAVQRIPGVGPGDLTTGQITVTKVRGGEHIRYRAREPVTVILHQPERAGEMVTAAIAAGATGSHGPRFFPGDPEQAYNDTLIAAFDQAKAKASALATHAGATLGLAINIEEGTEVVPTEAARRPVSAAPTPPVKPGNSTVSATVRVVFSLE